MRIIFLLAVCVALAGCGDMANNCEGVDTSRAPDSIVNNGQSTTYVWGNCSKTY